MSRQIRQFTPDERMQALHRAEEVGATRAGKELGVARCTIHRWQREARRAAVTAQPRPAEPTSPQGGVEVESGAEPIAPTAPRLEPQAPAKQEQPARSKSVARIYTP